MQKKIPQFYFTHLLKIMRFTGYLAIIIYFSTFNLLASPISAQLSLKKKITVDIREQKLKNAIDYIAKMAKMPLVFADNKDVANKVVSINVKDQSVGNILKKILADNELSYSIIDDYVVIHKKDTNRSFFSGNFLPNETIKGFIKNSKGEPIEGASVIIKETGKGTSSKEDGSFELSNISVGMTINISSQGYEPLSYIVKENQLSNIQITLKESAISTEENEVVVTGYQNIKRKVFSGSSSTLSAKELDRTGLPDVTRMLEGQFAGVSLQNVSGTFGAAPKLRIRGATSLSGDNKPLWVIDGIIIEDVVNISNEALTSGDMNTLLGSSIAGISPNDIQDITILRDAAATALYGARAMNGVVVVTTKKGRATTSGYPSVTYTGNFSRYIKPNYSDFDVLNSADQMGVLTEMLNKGYFQMPGVLAGGDGGIMYKMYDLIRTYDSTNGTYGLRNDDASKASFLNRYANANTNWFDIIFKNSLMQEHSVSMSSGTDKFQTYASTSYLKDDGYTLGNSVERFTGNFRMNFKLGEKFRGELISMGSVRNQRAPGTENQQSEPVYGTYLRGFDINPYSYALSTSRMLTAYDQNGNLEYFQKNYAPFNIINELNSNYMKLGMVDFKVQGTLGYKILPSLEYTIMGAYRYVKTENQTYILESSNKAQAYKSNFNATQVGSNQYLYKNPDYPNEYPVVVLPDGGFYNIENNNMKSYYLRQQLDFHKTFNEIHSLNAFASMEVRSTDREVENFDGVGYQFENGGLSNPYYLYFKQAAEQGKSYFGFQPTRDRFLAYMGTVTYAFKNRYVITPTLRYDGSNKMGKSSVARWLPTWNIAGSWNLHEESFWRKNKIISTATLRSSYGLTGNIGAATNSIATFYNMIARRPYITDQETLTYINALENSELTWEKSKDLDIGANIGFLNERITLMTDYYNRKIHDLIGGIQTSGIGGQASKVGNYGKMNGKGVEFTLNAKVITTKDFDWSLRFNYAHNTNKITDLKTDPNIFSSVSGNGSSVLEYPARAIFSVPFVGLNHELGYPTFIGIGSSDPTTYVNLQSDEISFLKYEGPADPINTGGLYTQFRFKNFTLSGLIKFSNGNAVRLTPSIKAAYSDMQAMTKDMLNRWIMPGDELHTTVPSIIDPVSAIQITNNLGGSVDAQYPYNLYNFSSARVVSGDYIKLANITLGYMIPPSVCNLVGMKNASITFVANNIAIINSDKRLNGQDPEFYNSGGVALPISRQLTFSFKAGF